MREPGLAPGRATTGRSGAGSRPSGSAGADPQTALFLAADEEARIALFERAVSFYASLVNINAYHQPGVQAGKVAADKVLEIQQRVLTFMAGYTAAKQGRRLTAEEMAQALGEPGEAETVFKICSHLAANQERGIHRLGGSSPADMIFEPAASHLSPPAQP